METEMNPDEKQLEVYMLDDYRAHQTLEAAAMSNPYNEEDLAAGHDQAMWDREAAIADARRRLYDAVHMMGTWPPARGGDSAYTQALDALADLDALAVL